MKSNVLIPLIVLAAIICSCNRKTAESSINKDRLYAWCIVPFDSMKRSPQERIDMLEELGIGSYAYDWRDEHLESMAAELQLAKERDVDVIAVWMWIDANSDSIGNLRAGNERVFEIIEQVGYAGQLWVSFHSNFFEGLSDSAAAEKGAAMIAYVSDRATELNCKVALYNHGDWFGEPDNQMKIIEALPEQDLGIVYNFHHAHEQIDRFPELVDAMLPHLWYVNLNGMRRAGPKILAVGQGDHERTMISMLEAKGYRGAYGILGHVEDADVKEILQTNLMGLERLTSDK